MAANYAEIDKVGNLNAGFQHIPFILIFWNVVKSQ